MTVCIAAICTDEATEGKTERKIVTCTDQKSSSAFGSSESARKDIWLNETWRCLTSGDEPDILALIRHYSAEFGASPHIKSDSIDAMIKKPLHQRKAELAEEYVRRLTSFEFDKQLSNWYDKFGPQPISEAKLGFDGEMYFKRKP